VKPGAEPRDPPAAGAWAGFHPNVIALGLTSLFTDVSTEMLVPVMPLFITATLGASVASLGLIEGIAECTASALRLVAGLVLTAPRLRTDRQRAGLVLWGGWLVGTGLVFSYMQGIFHAYYTVALAPAIGAVVGIGSVLLWRARRENGGFE